MNPRATALVVLIAVFAGGVLTGMLVERAALVGSAVAEVPHERGEPPAPVTHDREAMALELGLTPEQHSRIDAILDEQQRRIREVMGETRPQTRAILRETRARIEELLTPEQRQRWDELHAERRKAREAADRARGAAMEDEREHR